MTGATKSRCVVRTRTTAQGKTHELSRASRHRHRARHPRPHPAGYPGRPETLGCGGGYILGPCHNLQAVSPVENIVALYETAYNEGVY